MANTSIRTALRLGLVVLLATGLSGLAQSQETEEADRLFDPLYEVYDYIQSHFYKPKKIDDQEALYGAMEGLVEQLDDPYSEFLDPEAWTRFDENLEGEFSGVGIEITLVERILTVITPLIGTPAEAAGVLAGDQILAIDGDSTEGITPSEAAYKIRGETGTTVVLTIRHENSTTTEDIAIVRDKIVVDPVESEIRDDGTIGYIRILRFESDTTQLVDEALASFDLRHATVGAVFALDEDGPLVTSVQSGSSAQQRGLAIGDRVVAIAGVPAVGLDLEEIDGLTRGARGTAIELEIARSEGTSDVLSIQRDAGITGLILDLRNNAGGLMDQAISVASRFVDQGVLLRTESRLQGPRSFYTRSNSIPNLPLAVLINRGTASASEITAGAIRDNNMGILIGETSFGKGVYQQLVEFDDGSALKITTGEYFTPNGTVVHEVGLTPDILTERRTEPLDVPEDLGQELVAAIADGRGRESPSPSPWYAPSPFDLPVNVSTGLATDLAGSEFTLAAAADAIPLVVDKRFAPERPVPVSPERVISEGEDPIEVASNWIRAHTGLEMPFDLAVGATP